MIEISHLQAHRLLREHADRSLPEAQWLALQAHMESCPDCRAYRDRLDMLENQLRRAAAGRLRLVDGPAADTGQVVLDGRRRRAENRRYAVYAGMSLLVMVFLALFGLNFLHHASAPLPPSVTSTPDRSTPTLSPDQRFQGVVLFEAGDKTLNMLTAGPAGADVEPLTSDTRQDTDPAWSPDGEWVAFISDRAPGGKREIFLTNLVGGQLTQVTSDPNVEWQGPLAWSSDVRWLAVVGRRKILHEEPWVYLVPVDGTGSRVLPGTRGVAGGLRFTQDDLSLNPNILFVSSLFGGSIVRYDPQTGSSGVLTADDNQNRRLETGIHGDFDYAVLPNHYSLVYLASGAGAPSGWGLLQIRSMSFYINDIARQTSIEAIDSEPQGSLRSIHFVPGDSRIIYLRDVDSNGCWELQLRDTVAASRSRPAQVSRLDGLCVTGDLDGSSFSSNGRWLVVFAHPAGDAHEALYAVKIPSFNRPDTSLSFQLLASVDHSAGAPRVRPSASSRAIQPKPIQRTVNNSTPSMQPGGMEGSLLLSAWPETLAGAPQKTPFGIPRSGPSITSDVLLPPETSWIKRMSPDGVNTQTLVPDSTMNACPAMSPDRKNIAFLSDHHSSDREDWEVYVMDANGGSLDQLTQRPVFEDIGDPTNHYDCPVWSPDSRYLAVVQHTAFSSRLVVMTTDLGVIRSAIVDNPSKESNLVWSADSKHVFLVEPSQVSGPLRVISFAWMQPTAGYQMLAIDGWDDAQALSLSPDGKQLAMILVGPQGAQLRVYDLTTMQTVVRKDMRNADVSAPVRPGRIFWMAEGQIAFVYQYRPYERYKSAIIRYDPGDDTISYLVFSEDRLYDWALNGSWLVYSTESGVWGIEVNGRFDRQVAPIRLSDAIAYDLDWK